MNDDARNQNERRRGMHEVLQQIREFRVEMRALQAEVRDLKKEWRDLEQQVKQTSDWLDRTKEDSEESLRVYKMLRGAYKTGVYIGKFLAWCVGLLAGAVAAIAAIKSGVWK